MSKQDKIRFPEELEATITRRANIIRSVSQVSNVIIDTNTKVNYFATLDVVMEKTNNGKCPQYTGQRGCPFAGEIGDPRVCAICWALWIRSKKEGDWN